MFASNNKKKRIKRLSQKGIKVSQKTKRKEGINYSPTSYSCSYSNRRKKKYKGRERVGEI